MTTVKAIVRISTEKHTHFIKGSLLALDLEPIYEITGEYDMMVIIAAANIEVLNEIINEIKNMGGVVSTNTVIVLKEILGDEK